MLQRLTILCFFFGITNSRQCNREGGWVCCPGFVLNETTNQCIPCPDGYFGRDCRPCPFPYFGDGCTSMCNCINNEQCHHILGCTKTQGSGPEERTTVSSFSLPQRITATHINGSTKTDKILATTLSLQQRNTVTGTIGLRHCSNKRKHFEFPRHFLSVTTACFTAIAGVFLVLYARLHFCTIKIQPQSSLSTV